MYAYSISLLLQAAICEIKIAKIVTSGAFANIRSANICTHTVCSISRTLYAFVEFVAGQI